ncbi:acyl-CoA synthetase, partial [Modestobacter sp. VKM Ac-2676]
MNESLATILETVGDVRRDRLAVSHGDRSRTWAELEERAARLAGHLAAQGVGPESRVAIALYNGIEYIESIYAVLKLRAVPLNVNYRYRREEIVGLLDDARAEAVVFDATLAERMGEARPDLPLLRAMVQVGDGDVPDWAAGLRGGRWPP